jgi:hypothetical protein
MSENVIQLPSLYPGQKRVSESEARFVVAAMGKDAGKTTLAIDIALASDRGALRGDHVAIICFDKVAMVRAKRTLLRLVEPVTAKRRGRQSIELVNGGKIDLLNLDEGLELFEQYALVVLDDASLCDGLVDVWEDQLRPLLARHTGRAVFLGKPSGKRHGFWNLYNRAAHDEDWASFQIPTEENPHADAAEIEEARQAMPADLFAQEYEAEFLDGAIEFTAAQLVIGQHETFLDWCHRLAEDGLKVDSHPFRLDDRPAMQFIYQMIPSTPEEAFNRTDVIMKCTQVGFTVMEMLAMIYLALKFSPAKIGMYLPDMNLASMKSSERFMPIVRTIPDAYRLMVDNTRGMRRGSEGNVLTRNMGDSRFHFLWTSGKATTESVPLDVLSFDEVQEMAIADMEKTRERLSGSAVRYTLMGSTANWPDRDIHWWYKKGQQFQFWTECPGCGGHQVLDETFPKCIAFDSDCDDYRYVCNECSGWIDDPQRGEWRAKAPEATIRSVHFPQFLSPTISPRDIIESYYEADDLKNFYNRKLGKPYTDPSQVPVNMEMLAECAQIGQRMGVEWETDGQSYFMGIDQMGNFNVVLVCRRLESGHMAIVHAEAIYSEDPFERCTVLMAQYRIAVCVVETLPNYNDAKRFANLRKHRGRVFLAGTIENDMLRWGDAPRLNASGRRTNNEERDRYTVKLDQYKCMQVSMKRVQTRTCVFPDPQGLLQEVVEKGKRKTIAILKDMVFYHFTRTALIAEMDAEEKKFRRKVVKVGIDPHFSYAFMLMNVAWSRSHGTSTFILPDAPDETPREVAVRESMPGLPDHVISMVRDLPEDDVCGRCDAFNSATGMCGERRLKVKVKDPACELFIDVEHV